MIYTVTGRFHLVIGIVVPEKGIFKDGRLGHSKRFEVKKASRSSLIDAVRPCA